MNSNSAAPYIGAKISLVTNSDLRYEGILININTAQSTVTLRDVRMTGTERKGQFVMPASEVYDFIVFNGKDIKDLTVSEPAASFSVHQDPAVVSVNVAPPHIGYSGPQTYDRYYNPRGCYAGMRGGHGVMGPRANNAGYDSYRQKINSRTVIGELSAQPNDNLKQQFADAFDFEQANTKFTKDGDERPEGLPTGAAYNKDQSFFDNISCEALTRKQGNSARIDRDRQRELVNETFGPGAAAITTGPRYSRRPFKRGGAPRGRGRGGYMSATYMPQQHAVGQY